LTAQSTIIRTVAVVAAKVTARRADSEVVERFRAMAERAVVDERERAAMARAAARDEA
jgi:hypothetical protein